jgi:hypothetical protein
MKIFRLSFLILFSLSYISCSGLNSEIKIPKNGNIKSLQKPICPFLINDNCWQHSLEKIQSCMNLNSEDSAEYFSEDFLLCQSEKGKTIRFQNAFNPLMDFNRDTLDFKVYINNKPCLQFVGNKNSFALSSPNFGNVSINEIDGDTYVSCLDNESFVITQEMKDKGCLGQDEKISNFLPSAQINKVETLRPTLFSLYIQGDVFQTSPLFNCSQKD